MKWFVKCFRHYADFRGRAPLPEFWYFVLFLLPVLFLGFAALSECSSLCQNGCDGVCDSFNHIKMF